MGYSDDEAFFAQMDEYGVLARIHKDAMIGRLLRELKFAPISKDFQLLDIGLLDIKGLRDLLVQEDNTVEHLIIKSDTNYHQVQGFLEAVVTKLSSLLLKVDDLDKEKIRSFDDAIAAAKHKGMPIKLKTLSLHYCSIMCDLENSALLSCLERLELFRCPGLQFSGLEKLLQHPACKIWELCLTKDEEDFSVMDVLQRGTRLKKVTLGHSTLPKDKVLVQQMCDTLEGLHVYISETQQIFLLSAAINNVDSKLRYLGLDTSFDVRWQLMKPLGKLLESPYCELEGFSAYPESNGQQAAAIQDAILSSLEGNYSSRIQWLRIGEKWASKMLDERWLRIKYRNALFRKSPLLRDKAPVRPSTTKLFMCGHTGSGKTTISTNLARPSAPLWQCIKPPHQDHASTVGIERTTLKLGKNRKLLIYDLGGQEVYHAFHHYFIRGSDKDLFLVVCKVPSPGDDYLKAELQYWLRFIVAHQSATATRKPIVFLVLNIFESSSLVEARATAKEFSTQYKDRLSFVQRANGDQYFEVNGKNAHEVQEALKPMLETAVDEMLNQVPDIPWSCEAVIKTRASSTPWYCTRTQAQSMTKERVAHLHELSKAVFKEEKQDQAFAAEYTLTCLHDMGEAVYFGADDAYRNRDPNDQEAALLVNNAVLDMPWFLRQVLGIFIPQQERNDTTKRGEHRWSLELAKQHLKQIGESEEGNMYFLLKLLCEMGVLIPNDVSWPRTWSNPQKLPKELIVPALLSDEFQGWKDFNDETYYCWGRRLQPDGTMKDFVLLPSGYVIFVFCFMADALRVLAEAGVFAVVQAKVKEMCDRLRQDILLGDGWVYFREDCIQVLVSVGGDSRHWTDRQWVDIMLMVPKEEKRGLKGEQFMKEIKDCVTKETNRACPFIKLEEHVLNPRLVSDFRKALEDRKSSRALEEVKQTVASEGFDYSFTWECGDDTRAWQLLMPSEANEIIQPFKHVLKEVVNDYNKHIVPVYQKQQQQQQLEIPKFDNDDMNRLVNFLHKQQEKSMQVIQIYMEDFKLSITDIKESMYKLQKGLKDTENALINSCSSLLGSIRLKCPKLPHLTQESNVFLRYSSLIGKKARIHYLCEHPRHSHPVDLKKYPGVEVTVPHGWFKEYGNILVPAITMCLTLAKLSKLATPVGGELASTLIDLGKESLKTSIDSCFAGDLDSGLKPASEDDIRKLFEYVKQTPEAREFGEDRELMVKELFGLRRCADQSWMCKDHRSA